MIKRAAMLAILCWVAAVTSAVSVERGSAQDAQALVARAIAAYQAEGTAAFQKMTAPSTEFRDRDLYVFVIGPDHRTVAHGGDAKRVGMDVTQNVDPDGKPFGLAFIEQANEDGAWVDYKILDPQSGKVLPKSSWIVLRDGYIFGAGIYKE
jgi:cytochrome c